jgi:hypothetical protein
VQILGSALAEPNAEFEIGAHAIDEVGPALGLFEGAPNAFFGQGKALFGQGKALAFQVNTMRSSRSTASISGVSSPPNVGEGPFYGLASLQRRVGDEILRELVWIDYGLNTSINGLQHAIGNLTLISMFLSFPAAPTFTRASGRSSATRSRRTPCSNHALRPASMNVNPSWIESLATSSPLKP